MGLAKEVVTEVQPVEQSQPVSDGVMSHEWEGVPVDIWRYYGVYPEDNTPEKANRLKEINDIVSEGLEEKTIGNVMQYLSNLDLKMGATPIGESRLNRVWAYLKMTQNIRETQKRQRSFER